MIPRPVSTWLSHCSFSITFFFRKFWQSWRYCRFNRRTNWGEHFSFIQGVEGISIKKSKQHLQTQNRSRISNSSDYDSSSLMMLQLNERWWCCVLYELNFFFIILEVLIKLRQLSSFLHERFQNSNIEFRNKSFAIFSHTKNINCHSPTFN